MVAQVSEVNTMDYNTKQRVMLPHGNNAVAIPVYNIGFNIGPDGQCLSGDPIGYTVGPGGVPKPARTSASWWRRNSLSSHGPLRAAIGNLHHFEAREFMR